MKHSKEMNHKILMSVHNLAINQVCVMHYIQEKNIEFGVEIPGSAACEGLPLY